LAKRLSDLIVYDKRRKHIRLNGLHYIRIVTKPILSILYQDDDIVVINKPNGMIVHRSSMALDATENVLYLLRDQIDQYLYPVHRLDRKTSGVLLFALHKTSARLMKSLFTDHHILKTYHAIVRGYFPHDEIKLDYALTNDRGKVQEAATTFRLLQKTEVSVPFGKHETSRYSLVEAMPHTGRMHQIRKHLAHMMYPIIGDRPHGCNKQNKLFKDKWELTNMLLHSYSMNFIHPISQEAIFIKAEYPSEFIRMLEVLQFTKA
jgi:tRNA pseudouridine65 synthase